MKPYNSKTLNEIYEKYYGKKPSVPVDAENKSPQKGKHKTNKT